MTWVRAVVGAVLIALVTARAYGASLRAAGVRRRGGWREACADRAPDEVSGWDLTQDLSWAPPELVCTWTDPATAQAVTVAPTGQSALVYFAVAVVGLVALVAWVVFAVGRVNRRRGSRTARGRRA